MPVTVRFALIFSSFGAFRHHWRLSPNWRRPALGTSAPSFQAPAAELIRSTRISGFCAPFPGSKIRQDSTSPREVPRGSLSRSFPALFPARVWHASGGYAPLPGFSLSAGPFQSFARTPRITMAHQSKSGTVQFALDISPDARLRFESLHQSMGLKTKAQTFEAILYFVSTKDKIDPTAIQRMEKKIDHSIHLLESLT